MIVSGEMNKKALDTSIHTSPDKFKKDLLDSFKELSNVFENKIKEISGSSGSTIETLESVTTLIDDLIMRSPYTMQSGTMVFDAYWYNNLAKKYINELKNGA